MILQALVHHYESLVAQGAQIPPFGWGDGKVSYALCIDCDGTLKQVVCLKTQPQNGKRNSMIPQNMIIPAPVKRSSGVSSNFLCDNTAYFLGVDAKENPKRAKNCFQAAAKLHKELLANVDTPVAKALLAFFASWNPDDAAKNQQLQDYLEDMMNGANLVFRFNTDYVHEDPQIRQAWDLHYANSQADTSMTCLVTGKTGSVESIHPAIKGVKDAQSMGAALVSFNAPAFCSYGKEQNLNAPVSRYAAFAYTTALNHLLADREHVFHIGDATVVCWAENGETAYQNLMDCFAFDAPSDYSEADLIQLVKQLCAGQQVIFENNRLNPDMKFYILGLAPNAARLSVRFFLQNSFGAFLQNILDHHNRMNIIRPSFDRFETLPLWKVLDETVNQNSRNKSPIPNLSGQTLRAILENTQYPAQLLHAANLRIRAERNITRGRAAIIKAYYLKNPNKDIPKEVLTVSLNPDSTNIPYTLGRLFSVLETIQSSANPNINTTIKDRYFNSASATPAQVFPTLINLAQKHMKKLDGGLSAYYDKQMTQLLSNLGEAYPSHLSIPQQGAFQLGYYHQTQERYIRKNKEEN